jgi:hypothetical protein
MAVKILDNCCSPEYLDFLKGIASNSENWNLKYPSAIPIENRFPKLDIINSEGSKNSFLAGLAQGLLFQIYEAGGQELFIPTIAFCGISIKDKHTTTNIHTDEKNKEQFVKILGILNSDWEEEWGGGFFHNGTSNYIKPTSFCIFDPTEDHAAEEIFTDKKRLAIDFTVFRDQQSLEKTIQRHMK